MATSAYLLCRDDAAHRALERAEFLHVEAGDAAGAARCGFWIGIGLLSVGASAQAGGWFARASRLLDRADADCVERGYLMVPGLLTGDDDSTPCSATPSSPQRSASSSATPT